MVSRSRIHTYNVLEFVAKYTLEEEVKVKFSLYLIFKFSTHKENTEAPKKEKRNTVIRIHIFQKGKIVEYLLIAWLPVVGGRGFDAERGGAKYI